MSRVRSRKDLERLQGWFCEAITSPESGFSEVARAADRHLTPSKNGAPHERLLVYVRDYWARCLDSLHEDFPGLAHLMGVKPFHQWMEKYLQVYPSRSYTLRDLGRRLYKFMNDRYPGKDKPILLEMIRFEWAQIEAFDGGLYEQFDPAKLSPKQKSNLPRTLLAFQPHVSLLRLEYPVYEVVDRIKDKSRRIHRRRVPRKQECYTVVYRRDGVVFHREIEKLFYLLLSKLQKGSTLVAACDAVVSRLDRRTLPILEANIQSWFQICVANRWLCAPKGGKINERIAAVFSAGDEFSVQNRVVAAPLGPAGHGIPHVSQRKRKTPRSR